MSFTENGKWLMTFPVQYLEMVESIVRTNGGDVRSIYSRCQISPDILKAPDSRISLAVFEELLKITLGSLIDGEPLSLQIFRHMPVTIHGLMGMAALTADNFGHALDICLRYFPLILPCFELTRDNFADRVSISIKLLHDFGSPTNEVFTEVLVANILRTVMFSEIAQRRQFAYSGTNDNAQFLGLVNFRHASLGHTEVLQSTFRIPIQFSAPQDAIIFPRKALNTPMLTKNSSTRLSLESVLEKNLYLQHYQNQVVVRVRKLLADAFANGQLPNAENVADALSISTRTLSRRLAESGYTLVSLIEEIRMERADSMLMSSSMPLLKIAQQLGYSDTSTFSRAYRRVKKQSPSDVRTHFKVE